MHKQEAQFMLIDENYYANQQRRRNALMFKILVIGFAFVLILLITSIVLTNSGPLEMSSPKGSRKSVYPQYPQYHKMSPNCSTDFKYDYYLLALRWPETTCSFPKSNGKKSTSKSCPKHEKKWLIHGLWPNRLDGTWPQYCCFDMNFNVKELAPIVPELESDWSNLEVNQSDDSLWRHEWVKHGTCTKMHQLDYFNDTLNLFNKFTVEKWLENANIIPSNSLTYDANKIESTIESEFGHNINLDCLRKSHKSYISQMFLCVDKTTFLPVNCGKKTSSCQGSVYYPK